MAGPTFREGAAGFVLAGGKSTRMGRDKALLPAGSTTFIEQIAEAVRDASGSVTLIGPPERYAFLGLPVVPDSVAGAGPLGGLLTALQVTPSEWNLVVACDMPGLTAEFLRELLDAAVRAGKAALVPSTAKGLEPLCAVYHASLLPQVEAALDQRRLKMQDFVRSIDAAIWPVSQTGLFANVNTPEELAHRR